MRFVYRWIANAVGFYLGLYLVDSLIAPKFYIEHVWIAIFLAIVLGCLNSLVRPFPRIKTKPRRALAVEGLTVLGNFLFLMIIIWIGAPLSATNPIWVLGTAIFLTLLAALLNWTIGFKPKEEPDVVTRRPGTARRTQGGDRARGGLPPRA